MKTSSKGIAFIKRFEGFKDTAYLCPAGVWTIGYGFTKGVNEGDTLTEEEADARLITELHPYELAVEGVTLGVCVQSQFDALVSFAFNVGIAGMKKSTVIRCHNRGDYDAAAKAFLMWDKVKGKPMAGLTRRRTAEAALYLSEDVAPMPQAIDEEKPMSSSTINKGSIVAGGTATVALTTQVLDSVNQVKDATSSLGTWLIPVLLITAIGAAGYVIWQRNQQRSKGIA